MDQIKMSTKEYSYIADVGVKEAERLALMHEIFSPGTENFLKKLLRPRMKVLVVGCGSGEDTALIARMVGSEGQVMAIDISEAQVAVTQNKMKAAGLHNVTVKQKDIDKVVELDELFDLVFSRFVLIHLSDPIKALRTIYDVLKKGGRIACEEPIISAAFCTPSKESFTKHIELLMKFSQTAGIHFDLGQNLKLLFEQSGLRKIEETLSQAVMKSREQKRIVPMSVLSCREAYIQHELASHKEIMELVQRLEDEIVNDDNCVVTQVEMHQVSGIKL